MESPRERSIGAQMSIALQLMKKKNHHAIQDAGFDITMEQLVILEVLHTYGDMNMTELANRVWKQNANITRIVDKLEKRQLVIRNAVAGDRRANSISITKSGSKLFKDVVPIIVSNYKDITSSISKEEEEITVNTMIKIINYLSRT